MDLGYIGYGDGIFLEKLDFGPNWQFEAWCKPWNISMHTINHISIKNYPSEHPYILAGLYEKNRHKYHFLTTKLGRVFGRGKSDEDY